MKRHSQSLVVMLVLAVVMLAFPVAVDAAAGVSVAPQAGAPGTQFVVTGAGLTANGLYSLPNARAHRSSIASIMNPLPSKAWTVRIA